MKRIYFLHQAYIVLLLFSLAVDIQLFPVNALSIHSLPLSVFTFCIGLVFPLFYFRSFRRFLWARRSLLLFVGLLLFAALLSAIFSPYPALRGFKLILRYGLFFAVSLLLQFIFSLDGKKSELFYLRSMAALAIFLALVSFVEAANEGFYRYLSDTFRGGEYNIIHSQARVGATLAHSNVFGCYMSLGILLFLHIKTKYGLNGSLFYPAVAILLVAMALSGSRNAAFVLLLPLFILLFNRKTRMPTTFVIGMAVTALVFLSPSGPRFADLAKWNPPPAASVSPAKAVVVPPDFNSAATRPLLWQSAVRMFRDHPVTGIGPGSYNRALKNYASPLLLAVEKTKIEKEHLNAHNLFFNVLAELGLMGLVTVLAFFTYLYRQLFHGREKFPPSPVHALLLGIAVSFSFDNFIYSLFYMVAVISLTFLFAFPPELPAARK